MEIKDLKMSVKKMPAVLWNEIEGSFGEYFTMRGQFIAGGQGNRLSVWRERESPFEAFSSWHCNGYPVWKEDEIFWNDIRFNIKNGSFDHVGGLKVFKGYHPVSCEWSADAGFYLLTMEITELNEQPASRSVLLDIEGNPISILLESFDFAPKAVSLGKKWIVLGTRDPTVYDLLGNKIVALQGNLLPQRIRFSKDESLLLVQTYEDIKLWDTGTWRCLAVIDGPWLNAAMSPDAAMIYAIDFKGSLFIASISDSIGPLREITVSAPLTTINVGTEMIVASFARGNPLAWAKRNEIEQNIGVNNLNKS